MDIQDKIKGVLFGGAIGDALGLGTEFMTKAEVAKYYPNGLHNYSQIIQDYHRCRWQKGDWTDDTDMMLCIANSIIENADIIPLHIANEFYVWLKESRAMGIGRNTYNVLTFPQYKDYPNKAAEMVWKMSRCKSAANGGIMRTSIIGLWKKDVEEYAADVCRLTHYDPRCVGSCVIVSLLIHSLIYKKEAIPLGQLIEIGNRYDERIKDYLLLIQADSLESLYLDDDTMGYTLKTMAAAIWCLYHCNSFEKGLLTIVNAGGDADTNATVACSLLGAKFGYGAIPEQYIKGLTRKKHLSNIVDKLEIILR